MERTKEQLATQLGVLLKAQQLTLATAESCSGGGVAAAITAIPGSSAYFKGGIVAYANEVKTELLHVSPETLERYGAVSEETVIEMVRGAMNTLHTDCAVSTSGVAGPDGGTAEKPVGTIWMAVAYRDKIVTFKQEGDNGRIPNVENAIQNVLGLLVRLLD
jgi:PncC family amidohydrolase